MLARQIFSRHGGAPLVMIHGFLCGGKFFAPNISTLQESFDVVTVDLPGFGESYAARAAHSIAEMAEQVLATLDEIGCARFDLLGHSMGGMVALQIALQARARVRKLILYATNCDGNLPERFETFAESRARFEKHGMQTARAEIVSTWFADGKAHPHYPLCLACSDRVEMDAALRALDAMQNFTARAHLAKLTAPVCIIGGGRDRTYAPNRLRALQRALKNSQLHFLQECAHNAHLEDAAGFNQLVLQFLCAESHAETHAKSHAEK